MGSDGVEPLRAGGEDAGGGDTWATQAFGSGGGGDQIEVAIDLNGAARSNDAVYFKTHAWDEGEEEGHTREDAYEGASQEEERVYFEGFEEGEGEDGDLEAQVVRAVERVGIMRGDGERGVCWGCERFLRSADKSLV